MSFPFLLLSIFVSINLANGQSKEVGFGINSFNYTGDLSRSYDLANSTIGAHVYLVRNFKNGWSSKLALAGGGIKGVDNRPEDALSERRSFSFNDFLTELSASLNYDFLDYKSDKALVNFTPYVTVGLGFFLINRAEKNGVYSDIQMMLPFGGGIKYRLNEFWSLNFEFSARKTFFDYLDNISEEEIVDKRNSTFLFGNWEDNDWYYFAGLSVSYTFWNVNCPVPLKK